CAGRPAPDLTGEPCDNILTEPHNFAHLADCGTGAEMDHSSGQPSTVTAIALIDPLDHLFAPLVFKIDIDIRRFAAFFRNESLKDQGDAFRRNFGHAEQI